MVSKDAPIKRHLATFDCWDVDKRFTMDSHCYELTESVSGKWSCVKTGIGDEIITWLPSASLDKILVQREDQ